MTRRLAAVLLSAAVLVAVGVARPAHAASISELQALRDQVVSSAAPGSAAWVDAKVGQVVLQTGDPAAIRLASTRVRVERTAPVQSYALLYGGHGMRSGTGKYCTTGFIAHTTLAS